MNIKYISALLATAAIAAAQNVTITTFGANAEAFDWTYNSTSSQLSGIEGFSSILYGESLTSNVSGKNALTLTANVVSGSAPTNGFSFLLLDDADRTVTAVFDWGSFVGGGTITANFTNIDPQFNYGNVVGWNLVGGVSNQNVNVTLTSAVATTAVPEPSTFAAFLGFCALGIYATRRRKHITTS